MDLNERTRIAFKKLKASVYFDKTQLPLRDELVEFEESAKVDNLLDDLVLNLKETEKKWVKYQEGITEKISAHVFPKKLSNDDSDKKKPVIIFNTDNEPIIIDEAQYFLDMPVLGHILGTLWVLSVGIKMDDRSGDPEKQLMYDYSYGNRLRKTLINPESGDITYSPGLFEPYFSQYESWRDKALEHAKNRLNDKQDALILTMDFKRFFYSVNVQENAYNEIYEKQDEKWKEPWKKRLHQFVYKVLKKYSEVLDEKDKDLELETRTILPIGFLPSNILSNWILTPFDNAIVKRWNPVYYGRYVDDIIIVDKVQKNSPLRRGQLRKISSKLTAEDVIKYYFSACPVTRELDEVGRPLLYKDGDVFQVNPVIFCSDSPDDINSNIIVQNDKVKVFYFREGGTRALLDCFRTQIAQNASEFRYLPDMDRVLTENDYSEIFSLRNDDSIHKLRGVTGVKLDKFSLSKFLGKYRKVGGMIRDKKENAFDKDLLTVIDKRALIENYTLWERLLEIMLVNDRLKSYGKLVTKILDSIIDLDVDGKFEESRLALLKTLRAAIARTTALRWGSNMRDLVKEIEEAAKNLSSKHDAIINFFSEKTLTDLREKYLRTRMVNKYIMPLLVDYICLKNCINGEVGDSIDADICLYKLEDVMKHIDRAPSYRYYPYIVTPQDLSFGIACCDIALSDTMKNPNKQKDLVEIMYREWNYPNRKEYINALDKIDVLKIKDDYDSKLPADASDCNVMCSYAISVSNGTANTLRVAIGNARLHKKDFLLALTGKPNRSYDRYNQLSKLIRIALEEGVELLVLPENYLPWEWVPDIARLCANNQMALVTGIEHIISPCENGTKRSEHTVYNLTAVILPYRQDEHKYSHVVYHQKTHFSPEEKRLIQGYRMEPNQGNTFHLFFWRDVWFSVYCCFELASIRERSLFKSLADLTVAVEWNKDITYFSSIIESLCRDLHCYCIQANSSNYGDSRVISPSSTAKRDLVKTKGGKNSTILVEDIDIRALREFQCKEYELQKEDDAFKPTPPDFHPEIVEKKLAGSLWKHLDMACKKNRELLESDDGKTT